MSGTLRQARILSSETDNTIKQEQSTNVNINIKPQTRQQQIHHERRPSTVPLYPNVEPLNPNVNFISANPQMGFQDAGQTINSPTIHKEDSVMKTIQESPLTSQPQIGNPYQSIPIDRGIADMGAELDELDKQNQFLKMIIEMYESNPLKVNAYVICQSKLLMDMIKLLTGCEKVELILNDEDVGCGGCGAGSGKIIYVSKILVTKDGKTEDLKYAYNDIYSQFIKYGISLKMVC